MVFSIRFIRLQIIFIIFVLSMTTSLAYNADTFVVGLAISSHYVNSTSPGDGETQVSLNTAVSAAFSKPMDPYSISTSTFLVSSVHGGVAGTVSYDNSTFTATFYPASTLSAGTTYIASLTWVKDLSNISYGTYNWSFTTVSIPLGGGGWALGQQCIPNWRCTPWSACSEAGEKTRTCTDVNGCGDDGSKPSEKASCISVLPPKPREKKDEAVAPELPATAETAKPVEAPPVPAGEPTPAPIIGEAAVEKKAPVITLETDWWLLFFLVLLVIAIIFAIEQKRRNRRT